MKRIYAFLLTILLLSVVKFSPTALQAQTRLVRHYTINEGLSNNAVNTITQDCLGRIWIGTIDGLHSFDGNEIRVWRDESITSLGSNIFTLAEDTHHRLWIGSERGLALFDLTTERFSPLPLRTTTGEHIHSTVSHIVKDGADRLWIATMGQGIFCYNPHQEQLIQYTSGRTDSEFIARLMVDADGTLWTTSTETGISRYQPSQDNFIHVAGNADNGIISLFEDSQRRVWVGSSRHGLYLLDRANGQLVPKLTPRSRRSILQIRSIVEWTPGLLLLASDEGLTQYDTRTETWHTLKAQPEMADRLNDNYLQTLFFDRERALWVGTYFGGANYFSPEGQNFSHYNRDNCGLPARIVSAMAPADNGNLWIGTDDAGFYYWNRQANTFRPYLPDPQQADGYSPTYHNIHALLQTNDKLFIGMYMGGLDIMDLRTGRFRNYMPAAHSARSLYASGIYALCRDCLGNIWIGTTGGLNRYCPPTDDFDRIYELHQTDVSCIVDDPTDSLLWICSLNRGVFCLHRTSHQWEHFTATAPRNDTGTFRPRIPTDQVITACVDSLHRVWLGTDGDGLLLLDREENCFRPVETGCDIRVVYKIMPHADGLWLTTNNGLFCYHPESGITREFNRQDGLQDNQFQPNSGLTLADGTLLIGGINGFNAFHPDQMLHVDTLRPKVILSDFQLFNRPVRVGEEGSPLSRSIAYTERLTLKHQHSIFSLQVAALSYINPTRCRYRYRLEGFEKEWTESAEAPRVSYTNLMPGHYTFRVCVSTGNGIWHNDVVRLPIRMLPPWWLSTPCLLLYVLLVTGALAIAYIRFMQRQREKIELMRTEKDKELYQSKIEFFTLMIHELRTPLTLILAPIENIMRSGGSVAAVMPQLQMVERNGKRLFNLVNQLMDFRKTESGKMEVNLQTVELKSLLAGICQSFTMSAELKHIRWELNLPDHPCYATTDVEAFTKMVTNLLSNALKFTTTHIWVNLTQAADGSCELRIRDNGPGIMPDQQKKIFLPFYQVKENRPEDYVGTGIGLSLVKKLADLTDTTLRLESEPGLGSTFILRLKSGEQAQDPAQQAAAAARPAGEPSTTDAAANPEDGKRSLIVCDDNPDMLQFLHDILHPTYDVRCAANGREVLEAVEQQLPDLIISDVMMPVMDGLELCRRIKQELRTSHIPVVLLTAKSDTSAQVEGLESGADLYLPKPFSTDVILAQLHSLLQNRDRLRAAFRADPLALPELTPHSRLDHDLLQRITTVIHQRLTDPTFNVDQLAQEAGLSRTALFTKVKALIGTTPNDFIRLLRLKKAAQLLQEEECTVSEACYRVGFSSTSYFSKTFQHQFGMTPAEFKQRGGGAQ